MATLYERNGRFYVNYSLGDRRIRKVFGSDRNQAELYLKELNYRLFKGDIKPVRSEFPISYAISQYLKSCNVRIASSTCVRYNNALTHFQNYIFNYYPIQDMSQINRLMVSDYAGYRLTCKPKPKRKTINNELAIIRAFLNFAVDSGHIESNPASKVKMLPVTDSKKGRVLKPEEIDMILSVADKGFGEVMLVFLNTGMRSGELINLTWKDLEDGVIKIQEKEDWSPKTYERSIPINQTTNQIIQQQDHSTKYIFTYKGKKIPDNHLRKMLIRYAKMVGLPHITRIHDLRHTFCSNLLMKGVDVPTVSALLGHRSWNTTLIYSHQTNEHTRKAVSVLDSR